jgi:hypothetical protein
MKSPAPSRSSSANFAVLRSGLLVRGRFSRAAAIGCSGGGRVRFTPCTATRTLLSDQGSGAEGAGSGRNGAAAVPSGSGSYSFRFEQIFSTVICQRVKSIGWGAQPSTPNRHGGNCFSFPHSTRVCHLVNRFPPGFLAGKTRCESTSNPLNRNLAKSLFLSHE